MFRQCWNLLHFLCSSVKAKVIIFDKPHIACDKRDCHRSICVRPLKIAIHTLKDSVKSCLRNRRYKFIKLMQVLLTSGGCGVILASDLLSLSAGPVTQGLLLYRHRLPILFSTQYKTSYVGISSQELNSWRTRRKKPFSWDLLGYCLLYPDPPAKIANLEFVLEPLSGSSTCSLPRWIHDVSTVHAPGHDKREWRYSKRLMDLWTHPSQGRK